MSIIVKYGSSARGDTDSFSDRDFLIVGRVPNEFYSKKFDIVSYTKKRLERLRNHESLFLIHLRNEGVIIKDDNNWMKYFLASIQDYIPSDKVLKAAHLNLSIVTSIRPSRLALSCWFDMVYVFLRDYLVKLNAQNNHYIFSPECLLKPIEIKQKDKVQNIFYLCREIKFLYRKKRNQTIFLDPTLVSKTLIDTFDLRDFNFNFSWIIKNYNHYDPYLILRLAEYGLLTGEIETECTDLNSYINNPSRYSWNIRNGEWINKLKFVEQLLPADARTSRG